MAFKVAQLAKDLGIKSKQITELMTARGLECKTTQKSLDAKEFDIIFEALTREKQIADIKETLRDEVKLKGKIISTLQDVKKKYGMPRKSVIIEKEEKIAGLH